MPSLFDGKHLNVLISLPSEKQRARGQSFSDFVLGLAKTQSQDGKMIEITHVVLKFNRILIGHKERRKKMKTRQQNTCL